MEHIVKENQMNSKDWEIYNCIRDYITQKGYSPSIREIVEMTGGHSTSTIHNRVKRLERMGMIRKVAESARTIVIV